MTKDKANKKYVHYILILSGVLISIILIVSLLKTDNKRHPVNGVLDLQNWDAAKDGMLSFSGQWDFYWERFITYKEVAAGSLEPDVKAAVPGEWNKCKINGRKLPGMGYGTYVLKVINAPKGKPLAMRVPPCSTAYNMYINDRFVSSNGKVGTSKAEHLPEYMPKTVEFTPSETRFEIIVHISNFTYSRGGMWYAISLGTPEQIQRMVKTIADKDLFLFGALTALALYHLSIFLLRPKDKSSLYFVLMCVIFALRTAVYGDYLIYRLLPSISFETMIGIEYIPLSWFAVFSVFMVGELFPEETSRKVKKAAFAFASAMTLIILFTPISFYTGLVYIIQVFGYSIIIYCLFILGTAFIRGKKDALTIMLGAFSMLVCTAHDILFENNMIVSDVGEMLPFGLFIMLLLQSFALARRFSEAFKNVHELSEKLLEQDKIKDEFLANTSHELRTPLNGILGITEALLKGSDGELNGAQRQNLSVIAGSSRRLANLVNDILDYSKMKHRDIRLYIKPVRIDGLIYTVVNTFKQLSRLKGYEVISEVPEGLPPVMGDENRVVQILYNLVGNAAKFTVNGYVKISARKTGDMMEICVSDTGEGIPEDKLEDIFKSFEQVDNSLTRRYGGTGLGLPIAKQLVELQGGGVWVESRLGEGSSFYFTLPLSKDVPEEVEAELSAFELMAAGMEEIPAGVETIEGNGHILLVDDDTVNLQAAAAILKPEGYGITAVSSGKAALEILRSRPDCSLVILDVMMPEMSGYELCRKIRESKPEFELPVLMLTAKTSTKDIVLGFEAGANDYLPKPFEPEELLARVRTLTGLKASVDRAINAEVAFMQAQIKPHFLFNTLNTISSFCDTDPALAQQLIDNFSSFLRESFDFKSIEMFHPLERELKLVRSYVEIEKARFGDELKVIFDVDTSVKIKILFLSLQPLVENAICHGLRKKGGGGTVIITVKKVQEDILAAVEDDGQGIPKDKLETLLMHETGSGIGLWNIDKRLKKIYGKGLSIESTPGKGTRVYYFIPAEMN